jgi:hypothetical protein
MGEPLAKLGAFVDTRTQMCDVTVTDIEDLPHVVCPAHGRCIELKTGQIRNAGKDNGKLQQRTHTCWVDNGNIWVKKASVTFEDGRTCPSDVYNSVQPNQSALNVRKTKGVSAVQMGIEKRARLSQENPGVRQTSMHDFFKPAPRTGASDDMDLTPGDGVAGMDDDPRPLVRNHSIYCVDLTQSDVDLTQSDVVTQPDVFTQDEDVDMG